MRHVVESHGFEMLYADDVPDASFVNDALECTEVRRIAQHVAHADEASVLTCLAEDVGTLLGSLCYRFLE